VGDKLCEKIPEFIQQGMGSVEAGEQLEALFGDEYGKSKSYWRGLAATAINRSRTFGEISGYEEAGVATYEILAVMDERTSPVCKFMNGKVFKVKTAAKTRDDIINSPPEMVKTNHPWLSFKDVQTMTDEQLQAVGFIMPPFHFHCRTTTVVREFFSGTTEQRAAQIEDMSENEKKFLISSLAASRNLEYDINDKKGNEIFYTDQGRTIWPPNDGFLGKPKQVILKQGTVVDRNGEPSGIFLALGGTPIEQRSLDKNGESAKSHRYVVKKDFTVLGGKTAPWFNKPGGGMQYKTDKRIQELLGEFLEEVAEDGEIR